MNLSDWLDATNPNEKGLTRKERERRRALRHRVLDKAKTTGRTLRVAKYRGSIGMNLLMRLQEATKYERQKIKIKDQLGLK